MRIGIDARLIEETGVGRYIRNLIAELSVLDTTNRYVVFLRKKSVDSFVLPNSRWTKVAADVRWHTLTEQIVMPKFFAHERLDLVHIPYHNPPIFYSKPMVVTIHDLTLLHFATGKATTLPQSLYKLKRLGYWLGLWIGLRRAKRVIAVSETTKKEIVDHFRISPEKIIVTHEGVDRTLTVKRSGQNDQKRIIKDPYFLYVGNAYPHKNLDVLLEAYKTFADHGPRRAVKLVFVGKKDYFYDRLQEKAHELSLSDSVTFFGQADDSQLFNLYENAIAFVFPSRMEGFGLPALEALSLGCPVLASDIPIFHEILGEHVTYFDPEDPGHIARILQAAAFSKTSAASASMRAFARSYSWQRMARQTLNIYKNICPGATYGKKGAKK